MPCFAQAQELIDAQEKAEGDEHSVIDYQSAVDRVQWILNGADTAAKALVFFESNIFTESDIFISNPPPVERKTMTLVEPTEFVQAYYRATTLAVLGKDSIPLRLLSSWDMLDCEQVWVVNAWLRDDGDDIRRREQDVWRECDYCKSIPTGISSLQSWEKVCPFISSLTRALDRLTSRPHLDPGWSFYSVHSPW